MSGSPHQTYKISRKIMKKKIFLLFILLLLIGCNETEEKTFAFPDEIQKIIVMGQGAYREVK